MMAFPLFLASESDVSWADTAEVLAWAAGIPGLAHQPAVLYVPLTRQAGWRRGAETPQREGTPARGGYGRWA